MPSTLDEEQKALADLAAISAGEQQHVQAAAVHWTGLVRALLPEEHQGSAQLARLEARTQRGVEQLRGLGVTVWP